MAPLFAVMALWSGFLVSSGTGAIPSAHTPVGRSTSIGSPEIYRLLVVDRGRSGGRFEQWYGATLVRLLLDPVCAGLPTHDG